MLNFLGSLGKALPGYVQGQQQAVKDNWQDLSNYNSVQAGQLQNALDESLFNPRLQMFDDQQQISRMNVWNNALNTDFNMGTYPARFMSGLTQAMLNTPTQIMQFQTLHDLMAQMRQNSDSAPGSRIPLGLYDIMRQMYMPSVLNGGV